MSEEAKKIIKIIDQGHLPPLSQSTNGATAFSTNGIQSSQRDLNKTTYGLQSINEGLERRNKIFHLFSHNYSFNFIFS